MEIIDTNTSNIIEIMYFGTIFRKKKLYVLLNKLYNFRLGSVTIRFRSQNINFCIKLINFAGIPDFATQS